MIYYLIGLSLFFVALGFMVTERNAKYFLAGYNTLNKEDRESFEIAAYMRYFRRFHIFLGATFFILGSALTYLINENAGIVFAAVYPILAYGYFVVTSSKYSNRLCTKGNKVGIFILIATLVFVIGLLGYAYKENKLTFDSESVKIERMYGETLSPNQIESIELVSQLPGIMLKMNGFALGSIKKGYFKTENGEMVKLILNSDNKPFILITKSDGKKIYYSAKEKPNEEIFNDMKNILPEVCYK